MSEASRTGNLEVAQDLEFQRRSWTFQRMGWIVMTLVIVAALLGLFGTGPLSSASVGGEDAPLRMEYSRFARWTAPTTLRVHVGAGNRSEGKARVWLSRDYLEKFQVEGVTPEPESVEAWADRHVYFFNAPDSNRPATVTFHLKAQHIGALSGQVGSADEQPIGFGQFIYP
ncbi:MAG: hypothetical protein M3430_13905 [Acidobacteriota bacterium]|nr:hypothetical protein [Acidobacteriota bacterium]